MFSQNEGIPDLCKIYTNYLHIALAVFYISREHFFFNSGEYGNILRVRKVCLTLGLLTSRHRGDITLPMLCLRRRVWWPSVNDTIRIILPLESVFWLSISTGLNGGRRSSKGDYSYPFPKVQNLCHSITGPGSSKPTVFFRGTIIFFSVLSPLFTSTRIRFNTR